MERTQFFGVAGTCLNDFINNGGHVQFARVALKSLEKMGNTSAREILFGSNGVIAFEDLTQEVACNLIEYGLRFGDDDLIETDGVICWLSFDNDEIRKFLFGIVSSYMYRFHTKTATEQHTAYYQTADGEMLEVEKGALDKNISALTDGYTEKRKAFLTYVAKHYKGSFDLFVSYVRLLENGATAQEKYNTLFPNDKYAPIKLSRLHKTFSKLANAFLKSQEIETTTTEKPFDVSKLASGTGYHKTKKSVPTYDCIRWNDIHGKRKIEIDRTKWETEFPFESVARDWEKPISEVRTINKKSIIETHLPEDITLNPKTDYICKCLVFNGVKVWRVKRTFANGEVKEFFVPVK